MVKNLPFSLLTFQNAGGPGQLFHGGPGHPHGINSRTIGGFAQDIGALWENPPHPPPAPPTPSLRPPYPLPPRLASFDLTNAFKPFNYAPAGSAAWLLNPAPTPPVVQGGARVALKALALRGERPSRRPRPKLLQIRAEPFGLRNVIQGDATRGGAKSTKTS